MDFNVLNINSNTILKRFKTPFLFIAKKAIIQDCRLLGMAVIFWAFSISAEVFRLPTANSAIYRLNTQEHYFVGTVGRSWESGTFGCVRSGGWQLHEGIDIRSLQRNRQGEPTDPVCSTADGRVAYINSNASLSSFGIYIIVQHQINGLEIYSTYAHLSAVRPGLKAGQAVRAGEVIGTLGRTANTRERISKERAHLHFELNFLVTDRFSGWFLKNCPGQRNDHGLWNGQNLLGMDPRLILLVQHRQQGEFNLLSWVQSQPELCRVLVRTPPFYWIQRNPLLIQRNPLAEKQGVAGYELSLNYVGIPFKVVPRAPSEMRSKAKYQLLSVNRAEYQKNSCRRLVTPKGDAWDLAPNGIKLLDLLTF